MAIQEETIKQLFDAQVDALKEEHFLTLYWAMIAEDTNKRYNITNCFDDMKSVGLTRTKQTAVAIVFALEILRFIDIKDEGNRKNIYITKYGGNALATMINKDIFKTKSSAFLEGH